ncbi:MAG TPA: hypothetical protein VFJ30_09485 [Phycisphaerae bacterium]|nr:hypothetical protein [Phycisphaerae bacterium]
MLLVAVSAAHGGVGDLTPVAIQPGEALSSQPLYASQGEFGKPAADCGTVNPHAVVATMRSGRLTIQAAVDSTQADAKAPDVVRLDFTGEGKFGDGCAVPLKAAREGSQTGRFQARFGPATVRIRRGEQMVPVIVSGEYYKSGSYRRLTLSVGAAVEGACRFGGKTYKVRVIDGDNNVGFGDAAEAAMRAGKLRALAPGDTLAIDTGDGTFQRSVIQSLYGQPVLVDGQWYDVRVSQDGAKIAAEPVPVEAGRIRIDHPRWKARLVGAKHILCLTGGKDPIPVPADRYVFLDYTEFGLDADGEAAQLMCRGREAYSGTAKAFDVPAGSTTEIVVGSPLTATIDVQHRSGSDYSLSLKLLDASGARVDGLTVPSLRSGRPDPPKVDILNAGGERVYSSTLEYG